MKRSVYWGPRLAVVLCLAASSPALAQASLADEVRALRAELETLRAEQGRSAQRIAELEAALGAQALAPEQASPEPKPVPPGPVAARPALAPPVSPLPGADALDLSGDLRLRYEANLGNENRRDRYRGTLRARLRGSYALTPWLTLGAQLATGDPDDPNSSDATLSNFADDLQVSLDQAYARLTRGGFTVTGGKIPQPFLRTDLVWDSDVSPQGVSAAYGMPLSEDFGIRATGLYFPVDESAAGPDSDMVGLQVGFSAAPGASWRFELAGAYFDYSLRSVAGADAGDFLSNRRGPDGRYLSDFNLLNGIASVSYAGLGPRWPVRLVGDVVKNLGAAPGGGDSGFNVELSLGRASAAGDWRVGYGYSQAGVDAVLAAFSHDNTAIATNYIQHAFTLDYVLRKDLILNGTLYRYRPKDPLFAGPNAPGDSLERLRLYILMNF